MKGHTMQDADELPYTDHTGQRRRKYAADDVGARDRAAAFLAGEAPVDPRALTEWEAAARWFHPDEFERREADAKAAEAILLADGADQRLKVNASGGAVVSLDLGYVNDSSAITVLLPSSDRIQVPVAHRLKLRGEGQQGYYESQFAQLADVTGSVAALVGPYAPVRVAVDVTGNTAAIELLKAALAPLAGRIELMPVHITSGTDVKRDHGDGRWLVPKHLIVDAGRAAFQRQQADGSPFIQLLPSVKDTDELSRQLRLFASKPTAAGNTAWEAKRGHDDMVLSLFQGLWAVGLDNAIKAHNPASRGTERLGTSQDAAGRGDAPEGSGKQLVSGRDVTKSGLAGVTPTGRPGSVADKLARKISGPAAFRVCGL